MRAIWSAASANYRRLLSQLIPTRPTQMRGRRGSISSATSALAGTCGPGQDYKPELGRTVSTITRLDKGHRSPWGRCMRVGTRAISPSSGMSSIIWIKSPGTGARQIEKWLRKYPATGLTLLGRAIRTVRALLGGRCFTGGDSKVLYLGDPIVVGRVANINTLSVLDTVYASVRGKPFAVR